MAIRIFNSRIPSLYSLKGAYTHQKISSMAHHDIYPLLETWLINTTTDLERGERSKGTAPAL